MAKDRYSLEVADHCALCGSTQAALLFKVEEHGYWRCAECRMVRLSPRIAASDLGRFYSNTYGGYGKNPEPLEAQLRNPTFEYRARRLERYATTAGRVPPTANGPESESTGVAAPTPVRHRSWPYAFGAYVFDKVLAGGFARAEARLGWGNVVDVIARAVER